ncbi:MAG: hypothetical protein LBJ14_05695 [Desulfarculales bacterium]|jgi:hypothetical protein|nr:hypothetical protein [Desulfarculales bacterium]
MGRGGQKPVHLRPFGAVSNREKVWAAMRELKQFTSADVQDLCGIRLGSVHEYIQAFARAGYIARHGKQNPYVIYRLLKDAGVESPKVKKDGSISTQGQGREVMWRTMRIMHDFSVLDLLAHAKAAGINVAEEEAKTYCSLLTQARYLQSYDKPTRRYRLIPARYTGPKPPMIQRIKQIYDPNLNKIVWRQKGGLDDADE